MGLYINPSDMTKEEWLKKHGELQKRKPAWSNDPMPVALLDNFAFTAAGIAFDEQEQDVFDQGANDRPVTWYLVPRSKLEEVEPLLKNRK